MEKASESAAGSGPGPGRSCTWQPGGGSVTNLVFLAKGVTVAFRVPAGYDGSVVCFRNSTIAFERGQYIYEVCTPDDVFIRLN